MGHRVNRKRTKRITRNLGIAAASRRRGPWPLFAIQMAMAREGYDRSIQNTPALHMTQEKASKAMERSDLLSGLDPDVRIMCLADELIFGFFAVDRSDPSNPIRVPPEELRYDRASLSWIHGSTP